MEGGGISFLEGHSDRSDHRSDGPSGPLLLPFDPATWVKIGLLTGLAFLFVTAAVAFNVTPLTTWDEAVVRSLYAPFSGGYLREGAVFVTGLGNRPTVWLILLFYLAMRGVKKWGKSRMAVRWWVASVLSLAITLGVADATSGRLVKPLVNRPRPLTGASETLSRSYPSSHAANSFAVATLLNAVSPPRLLWWFLAAFISLSRVLLGVHYPTDVIGGALLGVAVGAIGVRIWTHLSGVRSPPQGEDRSLPQTNP